MFRIPFRRYVPYWRNGCFHQFPIFRLPVPDGLFCWQTFDKSIFRYCPCTILIVCFSGLLQGSGCFLFFLNVPSYGPGIVAPFATWCNLIHVSDTNRFPVKEKTRIAIDRSGTYFPSENLPLTIQLVTTIRSPITDYPGTISCSKRYLVPTDNSLLTPPTTGRHQTRKKWMQK